MWCLMVLFIPHIKKIKVTANKKIDVDAKCDQGLTYAYTYNTHRILP